MLIVGAALFINSAKIMLIVGAALFINGRTNCQHENVDSWCSTVYKRCKLIVGAQQIQRIKAMLLCIVYGMLFVYTFDTKIKAPNALNAVC